MLWLLKFIESCYSQYIYRVSASRVHGVLLLPLFFANWQTNSLRRSQLTGWNSKRVGQADRQKDAQGDGKLKRQLQDVLHCAKGSGCFCVCVCRMCVACWSVCWVCVSSAISTTTTTIGRQCQKNWSSRKHFSADGCWAVFFMQTDSNRNKKNTATSNTVGFTFRERVQMW